LSSENELVVKHSPNAARTKNIPKCDGVVAHDAISTQVQQATNFLGVVNGPYMNEKAKIVCSLHRPFGDNWYWALPYGHLCDQRMFCRS
jgi:hypothetical protein